MIFSGPAVKQIGAIDSRHTDEVLGLVRHGFEGKWKRRSLEIMKDSYVLKAISPTDIDRLDAGDERRLTEICLPLFEPFIRTGERVVYLDVSNLPAGKRSDVHFDYAWIHIMSRRLRIPIWTNPQAIFASLEENDVISSYNLKVGGVYETNNSILHCAGNGGVTDRWHVVADIIDVRLYSYLEESGKLARPAINRDCNFHFSDALKKRMAEALSKPATSII